MPRAAGGAAAGGQPTANDPPGSDFTAAGGGAAADASMVTLGLLSDSGLPAELSADLAAQLPDPLEHETYGRAR